MSLNFDLTKVADVFITDPQDSTKMHPIANALIWATIAVDIGEITEANAAEFYWRIRFNQLIYGGAELNFSTGDGLYLTEADVRNHIGLKTNVFPNKTRKQFLARFDQVTLPPLKQAKSAHDTYLDRIAAEKE